MIIKNRYAQLFIAGLLIVIAYAVVDYKRHHGEDKVFVQVQAIQSGVGWGYNITVDGKVYIHQEIIPAVAGRQGFRTKEDALKVGQKVLEKIRSNQLPTISTQDLKELGIIKDSLVSK